MFRSNLALPFVVAALSISTLAVADPLPAEAQAAVVPGGEDARTGEVSVDLEETTPGLTPEVFHSTLGTYGDWYPSPRYGSVWRPRVAIGWRPYFYGSWLWTDEGWYWDSDEPFAWAVYHYGRWVFDPSWGWVWVPGYQWAPAWVTWRFGVDAVGWAPLGPGVSVFVTAYPFVDFWWTFVPCDRFVGVPVHRTAFGPRETHRWYRNTSPAPPRSLAPARAGGGALSPAPAWGGPSRRVIEERIGRPIETVRRPAAWGGAGRAGGGRSAPGESLRGERPVPGEMERSGVRPPTPRRDEERGAPTLRPPSRGGEERSEPKVRPTPRGDEERGRPTVRPEPRGDEERGRPTVRPEPRGGEERRAAPPSSGRAAPTRRGGRDRDR